STMTSRGWIRPAGRKPVALRGGWRTDRARTCRMNDKPPPRRARRAILVLNDSDLVIALVTFAFRNHDVSVVGATKGAEALRLLERQPFDLVITDLKMPGMSGVEFLSRVRTSPAIAKVPAIALTGYEDACHHDQAKVAGADAYLTKPFTSEQ